MNFRRVISFFQRFLPLFTIVILLSSLLAGCRFPRQGEEGPEIDEVQPQETEEEGVSASEPRQDLPPALVEVSPIPGSSIALQQPITLYFNQAMDKESVEAAIHFEPGISGRFEWEGEQIITFTPDQSIAPGSSLHMVVKTGAQATNDRHLRAEIELDFQTADPLQVIQVVPGEGTQEVDPETAVFVAFNQPVVGLGQSLNADPAFSISPEVPGTGEWLNTSTFIFRPDPSMEGGTDYTITLSEDLVATSGAGLDASEQKAFSFSTTQPYVLDVYPGTDETLSIDGPVELKFNIRMDPESVEDHFQLVSADETEVAGSFEWDEDYRTLTFTPDENLERNSTYTVRLGMGSESYGGSIIDTPLEISSQTYPHFSVDPQTAPEFRIFHRQYGQYAITFTTPLKSSKYKTAVSISPEVSGQRSHVNTNNTKLNLTGYFEPETEYTVTLEADLEDRWGAQLGNEVTYTFTSPPSEPSLNIAAGYSGDDMVFVPAFASEIVFQATNINTVTTEISPISMDDLVTLLHPDNYDYRHAFLPETLETRVHNLDLARNLSEVVRIPLSINGESLSPGVYFLRVSSQDIIDESDREEKLFLIVSENNLVLKKSPEQVLVWGTWLEDYSPLADTPISIYTTKGQMITSGQMDNNGLFQASFDQVDEPFSQFFAQVGEPGQANFAFSISSWGASRLWEMGISYTSMPASLDGYVYTDRPIYRPGDTVYFKALIFSRDNGIPIPSDMDKVAVSIFSDGGMTGMPEKIYAKELSLNPFGAIEDQVVLSATAPTGMYRIEVTHENAYLATLYFDVAAYRKPNIELSVDMVHRDILFGEEVQGTVQADYYFGLPAAQQSFSWSMYSDDAHFYLPGYRVGPLRPYWLMPWPMMDYSPYGSFIMAGDGETDASGHDDLIMSTSELFSEEDQDGGVTELTLEVTLADESGLPVSYRESALVHPEAFYIGVKPEINFGRTNTPFDFSLKTVDWEKEIQGNTALEAAFESIEWQVEETYDEIQPYRYVENTTLIGTSSPITDSEGEARVSFTPPEPGTYRLTVQSGKAVTQVLVWVFGESGAVWPRLTQNQINLTADAEEYQPGQIAQVFIPNPFEGDAEALVTVERGLVMESQRLTISGAGHTLSLPIEAEALPNIYVSVIMLGKDEEGRPNYRQGVLNLAVMPLPKTLNVALQILPAEAYPGETVSAILTVRDAAGDPVQGEFSVAVVDKALLALVEANSSSILDAFYGTQPLSVQTSLSLKTYASQLALTALDLGLGGGGGMEDAITLREDFKDTAFWQAEVVTGADGTAQLAIPLPDNLTTWVVDVRGLTEDYQVGQAEAEILTRKDLMIQPVTPRFLVDGDEVEMAATVFNNTDQTLIVDVSLRSVGFELAEGTPVTHTVTLAPGGYELVSWRGVVGSVESVSLVFQADAGEYTDASSPVWGDLAVKRYLMPQTFSTTGILPEQGERLELVSLPMSTDPDTGELSLEMNPSLSSTLISGLEAFEGCLCEDTVSIISRLLANLNAYLVINELGIEAPDLETDLVSLSDEGIQKLLVAQNYDGGWSWWGKASSADAKSDIFITAYVLLGLDLASEAGLEVADFYTERTEEFLSGYLDQPGTLSSGWELDRQSFLLYSLRNRISISGELINGLYARRSELSPWALSLLGLTLREFEGMSDRVATIQADMEARAIRSATGVHWESERGSWMLPGTTGFNTAVSVFTLAQLDPASTSLSLGLQYLINLRKADGLWPSTFESAWSLMSITEALKGTGDYQADFSFQASLNDRPFAEGIAEGTMPSAAVTTSLPIETLFPDSPNALLIERGDGTGNLYYRVDLQTYQRAETAEAINRGINLQRDYYLVGGGCLDMADCEPIDSLILDPADPSQVIKVVLTFTTAHDIYHFLLEDFIPSGTEILDRNLLTSQTLNTGILPPTDSNLPFMNGWGWWLFNAQTYDDRILWIADYLPAGTYSLSYELVPYLRGAFQVLPAHAWQYFYPEVQGTSAGSLFIVE